jgi:hypothetical protein
MKKIHKLKNFYPEDFRVICIASHQSDYRLSWALNEALSLGLQKAQDHSVKSSKGQVVQEFTKYAYEKASQSYRYYLIANKSSQGFLLPDMKNIDYLFKIEGEVEDDFLNDAIAKIRKINFVIIAFELEKIPEKHKKKLIF